MLFPRLTGPDANQKAFRDCAGAAYPRMANFSFDYGNSHWTVLDANPYVDWTDARLRNWIKEDLTAARRATWRFVAFHQPPFNSSQAHADEQNTRLLADLFQEEMVDVVFCGHVHNYQRTFPLRFVADRNAAGKPVRKKELVPGHWTLDRSFDGQKATHPSGVIYLITGAGEQTCTIPSSRTSLPPGKSSPTSSFPRFHSLTVADVEGPKLTIHQVARGQGTGSVCHHEMTPVRRTAENKEPTPRRYVSCAQRSTP